MWYGDIPHCDMCDSMHQAVIPRYKIHLKSATRNVHLLQSSHVVSNCEIDFQDLEKVLDLAKLYIKY